MLAKRNVFQFAFTIRCPYPATDIIVGIPPVQFGDHKGGCRTGVHWSLIGTFLALHTLLRALLGDAIGRFLVIVAIVHLIISVVMIVLVAIAVGIVCAFVIVGMGFIAPHVVVSTLLIAINVDLELFFGHCG